MNKNKKNVAILTLPLHYNYGGVLQAYALQTVIDSLGYNAVILSFNKNTIKERLKKNQHFFDFERKLIKKEYVKEDELNNYCNTLSFMIVGSDQVWNTYFDSVFFYFLDFLENKTTKRIAYAASFSTDKIGMHGENLIKLKKLCKAFHSISVREMSGIKLTEQLGCQAELALDPTLLLNKDDWEKVIKQFPLKEKSNDFIFYYMLDFKNKYNLEILDYYTNKFGIRSQGVKLVKNKILKRFISPTIVPDWIDYIRSSKFVVTDSFHGVLFSIIFNRPFVVVPNNGGGNTRIESILSLLGLENCYLKSKDDITIEKIYDWENVNSQLKILNDKSLLYLKRSLL